MRMVHVVCIIHVTREIAMTLALHMQGDISILGVSSPDSWSDPIGGSESSSGCETQDWDSLPDFFFLKPY